jgi:small GTP-binding protein
MARDVRELKLVVVGNTSVGKTCIAKVATCGEFPEESVATLGASYVSKLVTVTGRDIRLQIWDTAGQERYRGMTPMYFRGANVAMVCYAIDDRETFDAVDSWMTSLKENAPPQVLVFLVGNKCDLEHHRQVPSESGQEKAKAIRATFYEVSAKTGDRVDELFLAMAKTFLEARQDQASDLSSGTSVGLQTKPPKGRKGCC